MKIGIKLANGVFYPLLNERRGLKPGVWKSLELTTVRDAQPAAQIDFYRNSGKTMRTAVNIGTLVVDNLAQEGIVTIDLRVAALEDGRILAEAEERGGAGGKQRLELALNTARDVKYSEVILDDDDAAVLLKRRQARIIFPIIAVSFLFLAAALFFLVLFLTCKTPGEPAVKIPVQPVQPTTYPPPSDTAKPAESAPTPPPQETPPPAQPAETSGANNLPPPRETAPPQAVTPQTPPAPQGQLPAPPSTDAANKSRKALKTETLGN